MDIELSVSPEVEQVVVGAGYAGVLCANRLARKSRRPVLLVSEHDHLLHRVRLHETVARGTDTTIALAGLLHPRVQHLKARAVGLDPAARVLDVDHGSAQQIRYRTLVLALGSGLVAPFAAHTTHALALASYERACAFHAALGREPDGAWINVIGGGLTAIELASELAEAHPRLRVRMVCDSFAASLPAPPKRALRAALARLGVEIHDDFRASALDDSGVHDERGRCLPAQLGVLATGFRATRPGWLAMLPTAPDGRVAVDHALRVVGYEDLYAVGDLASPPASCIGNGLHSTRMGCVNAMPIAAHAADVIAGGEARPFHFNYPGQNISLGRHAAITVFTDRDDVATGRYIEGRLAAVIKELVCRFVISALKLEAREWLGYAWLGMHTRPHSAQLRLSP